MALLFVAFGALILTLGPRPLWSCSVIRGPQKNELFFPHNTITDIEKICEYAQNYFCCSKQTILGGKQKTRLFPYTRISFLFL